MANTTSGTTTFDKTFSIDEIIEESYNRLGQFDMSGYNLKTGLGSCFASGVRLLPDE